MSIKATNWVWSLNELPDATTKLVLLKHADHAHEDGTHTWQAIDRIAEYALCSRSTAQRKNKWLIEHGYLREGDQSVIPDSYDRRRLPIAYELAMDEDTRGEWEVANAAGVNVRREAAKAAGAKGGVASAQVRRGANLTPQDLASSPTESAGVNLTPHTNGPRGVTENTLGVSPATPWGVTGDTQTIQEPSTGTTQTTSAVADAPSTDADSKAKVELTEAELETGRDAAGERLKGKKLDALAATVTGAWWEWIDANGHAHPAQSYIACRGVVRAALGNGIHPKSVKTGLARITVEGRAVSGASLQIAMGSGDQTGMRRGYDDVARWGTDTTPDGDLSEEELDAVFGRQSEPPQAGTA